MAVYGKIENNQITEYPLTEYEIKSRFTNVSWVIGEFDPPEGYVKVNETAKPTYDAITENCVEGTPVYGTDWAQVWSIQPATTTEIAERTAVLSDSIRAERNAKLSDCDWTQLPDVSIPNKTDWAAYRQALRDITGQPGFPTNVTWPTAPTS